MIIAHKPSSSGFFDQSKVHAVIFYDLPITPDGRNDDPVYYRIAPKWARIVKKVTLFDYKYPRIFEELGFPYPILKYLSDEYRRPNRMQSVTMKLITASPTKNLVAQARSGLGKELCSVVGMFQRLDMSLDYQPQAILMCPTLELAKKMYKLVSDVGKHHTEFWADLVGDDPVEEDDMDVRGYIGVPSTIGGLIVSGKMNLANIKMVILDESYYMLKVFTCLLFFLLFYQYICM